MILVSLNPYCGEIGSFCHPFTSQITKLITSLLNVVVNFNENVLVCIILIVNMIFLTFQNSFHIVTLYIYGISWHIYSTSAFCQGSFIVLYENIESNPGSRSILSQRFSVCQRNLNSVRVHICCKIYFLKLYNEIHTYNIICLSETFQKFSPNKRISNVSYLRSECTWGTV